MRKGDRIIIKEGWGDAGKTGVVLSREMSAGRDRDDWVPVLMDDDDDPTFFKSDGLEKVMSYDYQKMRGFRADAIRWMLKLFDESSFNAMNAIALQSSQPGIAYALEMGWIKEHKRNYWLTSEGMSFAAELAGDREDWLFLMADKHEEKTKQ